MAYISVNINGQVFLIPEPKQVNWGQNVTDALVAVADPANLLQPGSGVFTLTDTLNFGGAFGVKSSYFGSRQADAADAGFLRLGHNDVIDWRNFNDDGNIVLGVNSSNQLTLNGVPFTGSGLYTINRAIISSGSGDLSVATTTSTEIGYVNGVTSPIQTQLDSKLPTTLTSAHLYVGNVSNVATDTPITGDISINNTGVTDISPGVIVDADINASAAITRSKLASGTNYRILANSSSGIMSENAALTAARAIVSDANGQLDVSSVTTTELSYVSGVTSSIQSQLNGKEPTIGTLAVTHGGTGLATASQGDLLYGSASNTYSALAKDTNATRYLSNTGTSNNPAWSTINLSNGVSSTLAVGNGGTNNTTFTAYAVLCAGTTSTGAFQNVSGTGTSAYVLTSNGASALPTWQSPGVIAINTQTNDYALALTDIGKLIDMDKSSGVVLTVPKNGTVAFPIGTVIALRQKNTGQVTITPEDGTVTINNNGLVTVERYSVAGIIKVDTNVWTASGALQV